jgi:hypothetical protein
MLLYDETYKKTHHGNFLVKDAKVGTFEQFLRLLVELK